MNIDIVFNTIVFVIEYPSLVNLNSKSNLRF